MKTREEIDKKYKTDLTLLYKDEKDIEKDINEIKKLIEEMLTYKNKLLDSSTNFYNFMKLDETFSKLIYKIYIYYYFKYDLDLTDTVTKKKFDSFENLRIKWSEELTFSSIEIYKITNNKWNKFKTEIKELEEYDYFIKNIIRYKKHNLKPNDEQFFSKLYPILGSNESVYEILTNADAKFDKIKVNGKEEEINEGNYYTFLLNKDREVRKKAQESIFKFYSEHKHTISELYTRFIKEGNTISKLHKFDNTLESEMYSNNLSMKVYDNIISYVKSKNDTNKRILELFKRELGLEDLYKYDLYYTEFKGNKYSYEDGVKKIIDALSILGEEYISIFKEGINNRWIDVFPTLHKNSMQYNIASSGVTPLIHLNYNDTYEDVSTIAHEMGHAIHHYLSNKNCPFIYSDATTLATEVASLTNEILLTNYMLETSENDEEKRFILNQLLHNLRGNVFNQIALAEFERECHLLDSNGEALSLDKYTEIYKSITEFYNASVVKEIENSEYSWMRIPHIFQDNGFYVYKYSIDFLIASGVANNIIKHKNDMLNKYLNFLKSGSIKDDIDLFKEMGFDITKTKFMEDAFSLYDSYIDMYDNLLKKVNK